MVTAPFVHFLPDRRVDVRGRAVHCGIHKLGLAGPEAVGRAVAVVVS